MRDSEIAALDEVRVYVVIFFASIAVILTTNRAYNPSGARPQGVSRSR